jgi:tryptophanyl-tRNA synthetase
MRVHRFLRRGIFFSQQYLEQFLDHYEAGKQVFIYTGRGPSSSALHLGHMVPFEFTKYLQDAFGCILVVQMSDDEKFYFKGGKLDDYRMFGRENAKDIISVGFNPDKTYIFSNFDEIARGNPGLWRNVVEMNDFTGVNQVRAMFGLNELSLKNDENGVVKPSTSPCSIGMMSWPVYQSVPCLSSSFKFIFGEHNDNEIFNFVPMAVDQSPYFRLMNDFCGHKKVLKPAQIHSEFLIGLGGRDSKMSSTEEVQPIFLTDTEEEARNKIKKCFSGGRDTKKEHLELGADLTVDVSYQWLLLFMESDKELEKIAHTYGPPNKNGDVRMMTSEAKKIMADVVVEYLREHQAKRALVTEEVLDHYFNPHRTFDLSRSERDTIELLSDEEYEKQGCNFDRYFGVY